MYAIIKINSQEVGIAQVLNERMSTTQNCLNK